MLEPQVIYEDENFLAVDKPAGLLVHEARTSADLSAKVSEGNLGGQAQTNAENFLRKSASSPPASPKLQRGECESAAPFGTLVDWLLEKYPEIKNVGDDPKTRPGIVHRLDRETSGVMLVAKNQEYFEYLKSLFQKRLIEKTYLAVVFGELAPQSGTIKKPIGLKSGTTKRSVYSGKMVKEAITEYRVKKYYEAKEGGKITAIIPQLWYNRSSENKKGVWQVFSLAEVKPRTGRTHQIRVHLASIGHPVVGDHFYGPKRQPDWATRLMLHSLSVEFAAAEGKVLKIEAEPPKEFLCFPRKNIPAAGGG
jgi:23S rRNA pseudouridine1911/1915/1917 synthase